jgi:geranylgeranyl diphosphate synthase type I
LENPIITSIWKRIERSWSEAKVEPSYIDFLYKALSSSGGDTGGIQNLSRWALIPSLCCQAAGGDPIWTIDIAAAWILFYYAADLMDSVEDQDEPEKWWAELGPGAAINAASGMFFCASGLLNGFYQIESIKLFAHNLIEDFNNSFLSMCGGQHLDIISGTLNLQEYWRIAELKSGTFFALAARSGAMTATDDVKQIESFSHFGHHLGLLIQILDDLDDLKMIQKKLLPRQAASLKHSLAIVYSMEVASPNERHQLLELLNSAPSNLTSAHKAIMLIEKLGANLYILTEIERHKRLALSYLSQADPQTPAADKLQEYIHQLANPR